MSSGQTMPVVTPPLSRGGIYRRRGGFTLAELLVASVVMSVALLGIDGIFFHALEVEARSTSRWSAGDQVEAVAAGLTTALGSAVNQTGVQALVVGRLEDRGGWMICQTPSGRLRYAWRKDSADGAYVLTLQTKLFSGTHDVTIGAVSQEDSGQQEKWDSIPAQTVAKDLEDCSMTVRPVDQATASGDGTYSGPVGSVAVDIHLSFAGQSVGYTVIPRCQGGDMGEGDGNE